MAKKTKISSAKGLEAGCSYSPSLYVDFDDIAEVKGVSVGDEIRIVLKGTVKSVDQRESFDDPKVTTASISLRDFEAEIVSGSTELEKFFADGDD
jgi:hypothetical protein